MKLPISKFTIYNLQFIIRKTFFCAFFLLFTFYILHLTFYIPAYAAAPADNPIEAAQFVEDREVNFAGKLAARSADLLDWVIGNYGWAQPDASSFTAIWKSISTIVYSILILFVLAAAFILIVTRGQSITVRKFIPRFLIIVALVVLSFAIIQFIYQITDIVQGFFLKRSDGKIITSHDLLNVAFKYEDFKGLRRVGAEFDESAAISLLFVKLTAATYYAMFFILILRKVILWFFLVISPIFPLLLFFSPIRNTAKIWIGEFFRWLLYGPLFTIFLAGVVAIWQTGNGLVPLDTNKPCEPSNEGYKYPTAINILIGGPCQQLATNNTFNIPQSFIQYIIALLMLWMVIIMPFILLKIFLDYLSSLPIGETNFAKYLINAYKPKPAPPPPSIKPTFPTFPKEPIVPKPPQYTQAGRAMELPRGLGIAREFSHLKPAITSNSEVLRSIKETLALTNLKIPSIRDVVRFDSAHTSKDMVKLDEVNKLHEAIRRVAGTSTLMAPTEKAEMEKLKQIIQEASKSNPVAASIVEATKEEEEAAFPEENNVQQVNLDDYEEIKKTWEENYRNLETPNEPDGKPMDRKQWVREEAKNISSAIDLLLSEDVQKVNQGKQMVSKILPFLLLGGFSKTEVVAYLKAKLEAAKTVEGELSLKEGEEFVDVEAKKKEELKEQTLERKIPGTS